MWRRNTVKGQIKHTVDVCTVEIRVEINVMTFPSFLLFLRQTVRRKKDLSPADISLKHVLHSFFLWPLTRLIEVNSRTPQEVFWFYNCTITGNFIVPGNGAAAAQGFVCRHFLFCFFFIVATVKMMTTDNWLVYGLTPSTDCQVIACRTGDRWESAGSSSSLSESQEVNKMSHAEAADTERKFSLF